MCFDEKHPSWGQDIFITDKVLEEKYLLNDKAVFSAEITNVKPNFLKVTSISRTMGTAESLKLMDVARKNSRFTWKITRFSSFDGVTHSSYEFTLGPRRWYAYTPPFVIIYSMFWLNCLNYLGFII